MKIKLDENLPESLLTALVEVGHDADTVRAEGIAGSTDPDVWQAAQHAGRFLVTQDLDFSDARRFAPGSHCGLMLVRLREPGRLALVARISAAFRDPEAGDWERCFVLLTDTKLRIRRPPGQT